VTRRTKLSRSDRERRAGKRETRRARREVEPLDREPGVVCLKCGLEQPYVSAPWIQEEYEARGFVVEVVRCQRGTCDGEVAETVAAHAE